MKTVSKDYETKEWKLPFWIEHPSQVHAQTNSKKESPAVLGVKPQDYSNLEPFNRQNHHYKNDTMELVKEAKDGLNYRDIATLLFLVPHAGTGDAFYWERAVHDNIRVTRALALLVWDLAHQEEGLQKTRLCLLSRVLFNVNGKGRGDVHYWCKRSGELQAIVFECAKQLDHLSKTGTATLDTKKSLRRLAQFAMNISSQGKPGEQVFHWYKAAEMCAYWGHIIGKTTSYLARGIEDKFVKEEVQLVGQLFEALLFRFVGCGDVQYWKRTTKEMTADTHRYATNIQDVSLLVDIMSSSSSSDQFDPSCMRDVLTFMSESSELLGVNYS